MNVERKPLNLFFLAFLLLPVAYCYLFAPYGYSDTDEGFIQGISWRILNGEKIYTDFTYVRPPLTPWLHAFEMKLTGGSVLASRYIYFGFLWLTVLFSVLSIRKFLPGLKSSAWMLACFAFIVEAHNAPAMPFHTTDGVLFGAIGIFLLSRGPSSIWLASGLFSLLLSALCKQSFYLLPVAGVGAIYFLYGKRKFFQGLLIAGGLAGMMVLSAWMLDREGFSAMLHQTTGTATLNDFFIQGFLSYLKPATAVAIVLIFLLMFPRLISENPLMGKLLFSLWILFLSGIFVLNIIVSFKGQTFQGPSFGWTQSLFLFSLNFVLFLTDLRKELKAILLLQLILTWASGISWGYAIPIHNATPMVVMLFLAGLYFSGRNYAENLARYGAIFCFAGFLLLLQFPYRDDPRALEVNEAGIVFPQLNGIHTGASGQKKWTELKILADKYPYAFSVMPAMPQANFLTGTSNPFPWDWEHNAEMNIRDSSSVISKFLRTEPGEKVFVFIQKDHLSELNRTDKYGSWVSVYVRTNWKKLEETDYFEVYSREKPI